MWKKKLSGSLLCTALWLAGAPTAVRAAGTRRLLPCIAQRIQQAVKDGAFGYDIEYTVHREGQPGPS
jgi:hypothetical protein